MENLEKKICKILNDGLELDKKVIERLYLSRKEAIANIKQSNKNINKLIFNLGKVVGGLITAGALSAFIYGYVQENKNVEPNMDSIIQSIKNFGMDTGVQKINSLE